MPPVSYANFEFNRMRQEQRWSPIEQFNGDLAGFASFAGRPHPASGATPGISPHALATMKAIYPEVEAGAGAGGLRPGKFMIYVHAARDRVFVSLARSSDPVTLVWSCWNSEELEPAASFRRMGAIARGKRTGIEVVYPAAEDKAFMWKASSVHPLQVLENAYQRIVHHAGREPDADRIKEQSETLARYFIPDAGPPVSFTFTPADLQSGPDFAAVRMNHLIEGFYLFRLLVPYRIKSAEPISDDLRAELSGDLTKLLHNGDAGRMGWLSKWLTEKIAELGRSIRALNRPGQQRRVVFFLKGGRALNFYLGTPEKGENDWDTQVVIDPGLPAEDWYRCYSEVHDVLLAALRRFKAEFTALVEANASPFAEYLRGKTAPDLADDDESARNEASDIHSGGDTATCKAELIDIGIPRRDSASALEEWTRLSAQGALLEAANGVVYPHRTYYLNEYLMMIRDAFLPNADAKKAPKRITRFGLILASEGPSMVDSRRLAVLPKTADRIATIQAKGRRELFGIMMSEFAQAYNLVQDRELAALFDTEAAATVANPPALPPALAKVLDGAQGELATDVGVAHALSERMAAHWTARTAFFQARQEFFDTFLRDLARATNRALGDIGAQFAVAGSYAARLHARHLRMAPDGLEPVRRILVKLQCPRGSNEAQVLAAVAQAIAKAAADSGKLAVADVPDAKNRSMVLLWKEKVPIEPFNYAPLVMKIRGAAQGGNQLPVLASIDGMPVLDLRYLAADYLKKTSKIDEQGSRRVLASAAAAVSEMLSRFDFDSDEDD
ncbi:hypothetical protein [Ramlibacter sp. AN1133]|uniref:hypothetical protein n=1 Tax=Ramlibacter sp. AN1133 TaxID=3133429 RepID=UPI0030BF2711